MGILDRLFPRAEDPADPAPGPMAAGGRQWTVPVFRSSQNPDGRPTDPQYRQPGTPQHSATGSAQDRRAIERYEYLLRTAPPEQLEQAHAEAFAELTQAQREQVRSRLVEGASAQDRPEDATPESLARAATRTEARRPGTLRRVFGEDGSGSSLLSSIAAAYIGTALAQAMFGVVLDGGGPVGPDGRGGHGAGFAGDADDGAAHAVGLVNADPGRDADPDTADPANGAIDPPTDGYLSPGTGFDDF